MNTLKSGYLLFEKYYPKYSLISFEKDFLHNQTENILKKNVRTIILAHLFWKKYNLNTLENSVCPYIFFCILEDYVKLKAAGFDVF